MSALSASEGEIAQGGSGREKGAQGGWGGDNPRRSGSRLAEDEFLGSEDPGIKSSMIDLKIEEIRVLSAYSFDVILINPHAFRIKSRQLIARIF